MNSSLEGFSSAFLPSGRFGSEVKPDLKQTETGDYSIFWELYFGILIGNPSSLVERK